MLQFFMVWVSTGTVKPREMFDRLRFAELRQLGSKIVKPCVTTTLYKILLYEPPGPLRQLYGKQYSLTLQPVLLLLVLISVRI